MVPKLVTCDIYGNGGEDNEYVYAISPLRFTVPYISNSPPNSEPLAEPVGGRTMDVFGEASDVIAYVIAYAL